MRNFLRIKNYRGDTIIEVILSIAVLGTAMSVAYVSTTHSLQVGTDAGNRNRAVGLMQQQLEQIKVAEAAGDDGHLGSYIEDNKPFCIDPSSGAKLSGGSDGYCTVCTTDGVIAAIISSDSSCPADTVALYTISITYSGDDSRIFTAEAKWAAPNGSGKGDSISYYKLPESTSVSGAPSVAIAALTIMSNPDIAGGLGPTLKMCVNGGTTCVTKAYTVAGTQCPTFSTTAPPPEGNHTAAYDADERCKDEQLPLDLSSIPGPITDISLQFVTGTDYNGYRAGHDGDSNYYMDSNIIVKDISITGKTIGFNLGSYSIGAPNTRPPNGGAIGPYVLWEDWPGTATFKVN